jgi:hypothetical protein
MNPSEARSFVRDRVLAALPAVAKFILMNSPDRDATLVIWAEAIEGLDLADCKQVLSEWVRGTRDPLTDEEMANFPSTLISACRSIAFKKSHGGALEDIRRVDPGKVSRVAVKPYVSQIWGFRADLQAGLITQDEFRAKVDSVLDQHSREYRAGQSQGRGG